FATGLFLITFLVFANGVGNKYALDDEFYTNKGNKLTLKGIKGIPEIFKSHTFYNNDGTSYSYRPVTLTTFAIETQLFGESPTVSHFVNVLLYALTIVLLFSILRKWFVTQGNWFSFFICLLFIVHPLHTEVVDNIKCRDELLAILFMLLTIHAIWKHLETKKVYWLILYPLLFWAGMLSKHTAVPFYALIPLTMYFFSDTKWWKIILYVAPLLITTMMTSFFQKHNLQAEIRDYLPFENPLAGNPGFGQLTATSFYVMGRYLYLLIIPHPLVYYYGSYYVPDITWSNPIAIVSLIVYAALGIWALKELRKKSVLGFGLLFFLINIGAYSNLLQRAPGIMAERYTYAASLGFCIVVIVLLSRFMKINLAEFRWKSEESKKFRTVIIVIALLFSVRTVWRTEDWYDKKTLYGNDMEYLEESVKANMLYAALLSYEGTVQNFQSRVDNGRGGVRLDKVKQDSAQINFQEAKIHYRKAAELAPYYHTAWSNLGTMYFFSGETDSALFYFKKGVAIKNDYAEGWFNIAKAYDKLEKNDSAIYAINKCLAADSAYVNGYDELARQIMKTENNPEKALAVLRTAARKKPNSELPWTGMAGIYAQQKDTVQWVAATERAAEINPTNLQRIYVLAQYFQKSGDINKFNYYNSLVVQGNRKAQEEERKRKRRK
ncbi:MAG: glycosyltransferase family 39 protein, partial [Bacteroidota bacterium]|nr:glycosyltransferase family 39 protein [Bacteroidota bacterium]